MKAVLRYLGGKNRYAREIIEHFPPHFCYLEPCGGSAGVLLNKAPSAVEIYNDLDGEVAHPQYAVGGLPAGGKGLRQDVVQRFAVGQLLLQRGGLGLQLGVGHGLILAFQCQHLFGEGVDLFQLPVREAAKEFFS